MFNDNDESAVAGLLALGTSTNDAMTPGVTFSDFAISPLAKEPSASQALTPSKHVSVDLSATFSPGQIANAATPSSNIAISSTQTLELLRHYRYEVAPWVSVPLLPVIKAILTKQIN